MQGVPVRTTKDLPYIQVSFVVPVFKVVVISLSSTFRLVCDQAMEKKIYERQVTKQGMSGKSLNQISSLYSRDCAEACVEWRTHLRSLVSSNTTSAMEDLWRYCDRFDRPGNRTPDLSNR